MTNNRKLVPVEQAMEILNRCAGSANVVTISRVKGPLRQEIVRQALDLIQCRHPRFRARIVGSLDSLRFESGGTRIPLRRVQLVYPEQWQAVAREELNQKIESSKVLLRGVLVHTEHDRANYLLTTIHHAISDGLSCVQLHSELLTYCQRIASGDPPTQVTSLSTLPPLEELLPKSVKGLRGATTGLLFLLRLRLQMFWNRPETLRFEQYVPTELRRSNLVHRRLDEALTQQFVAHCRQEQTTVQGALCTALLFAVARRITAGEKIKVRLSCRSMADLRRLLEPVVSDENMGLLASSVMSFHTLRPTTSFWELARDVRQQLEAGLGQDDIFSVVLLLKKMITFLLAHPHKVPVTVAVSNIGRVKIPQVYGLFELEEISFVTALGAFAGVLAAAVSTFQGKMLLNFMFSEPVISQDTVEALANDVVSCIIKACQQEVAAVTQ